MTDRFHSLTVVLEQDTRDDDAEPILQAIRMIKGVLSVSGTVADIESHMAEDRARQDITVRVFEALKSKETH